MTTKTINPRPRGRPSKEIPKIDASPQRLVRAIFSAVKKPDPWIRVPKTHTRNSKQTQQP